MAGQHALAVPLALLTVDEALKDAIPVALWLLDALPEGSPFLALEPAERRRQTFAAVKRILLREVEGRPLLLVFEDLHWADEGLVAFVEYLILLGLEDVKSEENRNRFRSELNGAIKRFMPEEIYMPHPEIDKHPTHRTVSAIALQEIERLSGADRSLKPRVWSYEVWTPFPAYDRIEDVSLQMHVKTAAIDAHRSQIEYKDYTDGMRGLNRYRAVFNETAGVTVMEYAEVFTGLRP